MGTAAGRPARAGELHSGGGPEVVADARGSKSRGRRDGTEGIGARDHDRRDAESGDVHNVICTSFSSGDPWRWLGRTRSTRTRTTLDPPPRARQRIYLATFQSLLCSTSERPAPAGGPCHGSCVRPVPATPARPRPRPGRRRAPAVRRPRASSHRCRAGRRAGAGPWGAQSRRPGAWCRAGRCRRAC